MIDPLKAARVVRSTPGSFNVRSARSTPSPSAQPPPDPPLLPPNHRSAPALHSLSLRPSRSSPCELLSSRLPSEKSPTSLAHPRRNARRGIRDNSRGRHSLPTWKILPRARRYARGELECNACDGGKQSLRSQSRRIPNDRSELWEQLLNDFR